MYGCLTITQKWCQNFLDRFHVTESIVYGRRPFKTDSYILIGLRNPYKHISSNENYNNVQGNTPLEIQSIGEQTLQVFSLILRYLNHSASASVILKTQCHSVISRNNKKEIQEVTSNGKNFEDNFSCRNRFNLVPFPQQI